MCRAILDRYPRSFGVLWVLFCLGREYMQQYSRITPDGAPGIISKSKDEIQVSCMQDQNQRHYYLSSLPGVLDSPQGDLGKRLRDKSIAVNP